MNTKAVLSKSLLEKNYCKPYFTNKGICNDEPIILVEKNLRKNAKICKTFDDYFVNITDELDIYQVESVE